ncbi:hypothetical protein ACFLKC_14340 [Clostridium caseinilyticum]|uniref:hypothetical protein n=1 Tax=Clostridium caseinilyticum TaxID=3350403 RepID=UPI0038F62825
MNSNELEINKEIDEMSIKRFLAREEEYKEIAKLEVIKKISEHCENVEGMKNMKYLIMGVISTYDFQISWIKEKIKDKVIVETFYPEEMKEESLKRFPPYI